MSDANRNSKGQFKGSGNPKGRPLKIARDPRLPAARRAAVFKVADRPIQIVIDGEQETMSIFEACLFRMGAAGASGNRISAKDFVQMTMEVSEVDLGRRIGSMKLLERMNAVEEENERLRAKSGRQGGVITLPWDEFEAFQDRRLDDGIHLEEAESNPDSDDDNSV